MPQKTTTHSKSLQDEYLRLFGTNTKLVNVPNTSLVQPSWYVDVPTYTTYGIEGENAFMEMDDAELE